jgi:phage-related holin
MVVNEMQEMGAVSLTIKTLYNLIAWSFAALLAYLKLPVEMMSIYFTLLMVDLVTGWMAAFVVGELLSMSRFLAGFFTKFLMIIIPVVVALIMKMKGDALIWFIEWTIIVLAVSEGISIFNNVLKAKGEKPLPKLDALAMISDKLRVLLESWFKKGRGE